MELAMAGSAGYCSMCAHDDHDCAECPVFRAAMDATSKKAYLAEDLAPEDREGFAAAGILFYSLDDPFPLSVLMAKELRVHSTLRVGVGTCDGVAMNFIGGKRNSLAETPINTALREFAEETMGVLPRFQDDMGGRQDVGGEAPYDPRRKDAFPRVLWVPDSKYALFVGRIPEKIRDIDLIASATVAVAPHLAVTSHGCIQSIEWVDSGRLASGGVRLHPFASAMTDLLVRAGVFDTAGPGPDPDLAAGAASLSSGPPPPSPQTEIETADGASAGGA